MENCGNFKGFGYIYIDYLTHKPRIIICKKLLFQSISQKLKFLFNLASHVNGIYIYIYILECEWDIYGHLVSGIEAFFILYM